MDDITEGLSSLTAEEATIAVGMVDLMVGTPGYDENFRDRFAGGIALVNEVGSKARQELGSSVTPEEAARYASELTLMALIEASGMEDADSAPNSVE